MTTTVTLPRSRAPIVRKLGYRPDLDGIRGVAVLIVMFVHTTQFLGRTTWAQLHSGYFGVEMFFTLSGFLITTLLLEERGSSGRIDLGQFYARRALRLFPALVFGVGLAGVGVVILGANLRGLAFPNAAALVFACIANWSERSLGLMGHLWTLSVEEQFYLVWPVLLIAGLRAKVKCQHMAGLLLGAASVVALVRVLVIHVHEPNNMIWGLLRADAVMVGSALALLLSLDDGPLRRALADRRLIAGAAAVLAAFVVYVEVGSRLGRPGHGKDLLLVGTLAFTVLMGAMIVRPASGPLTWGPIVRVGRLSYSIYLVHYPLFIVLARVDVGPTAVRAVVAWTLAFALALFSYHLIEQPALRLKKRLAGRGTKPHAPADDDRDWDRAAADELFLSEAKEQDHALRLGR